MFTQPGPDILCTFKTAEGDIVTVTIPKNTEPGAKLTTYKIPDGSTFLSSIPPNWIPINRDEKIKWYRKA